MPRHSRIPPSPTPTRPSIDPTADVCEAGKSLNPAELAQAVAAELVPRVDAALRGSLQEMKGSMHDHLQGFIVKIQEQTALLQALSSDMKGTMQGNLQGLAVKLQEHTALVEGAKKAGADKGAEDVNMKRLSAKLDTMVPELGKLAQATDFLEERLAEAMVVQESRGFAARSKSLGVSLHTKTEDAQLAPKRLAAARTFTKEHELSSGERAQAGRTVVINIRRLQTMLQLCRVYAVFIQCSTLVGMAPLLFVQTVTWAQAVFMAAVLLMYAIHQLQCGTLGTSSDRVFGVGTHIGNDGQALLDCFAPGMENPSACIQALTWRRRWHFVLARGSLALLSAVSVLVWVALTFVWAGADSFLFLSAADATHVAVLNGFGTAYLLCSILFGLLLQREMHGIMPVKGDGKAWDVSADGAPGAFGRLLGPPCVWFGSASAYDDLRIWTAMASSRSAGWAIIQSAPHLFPEELGVYALQGRDSAGRLANALSEVKLFDSHRRRFLRRLSEKEEMGDMRPAAIVTGLSKEAEGRGHLFDVDMRRELPEALQIQLLLYDSRTGNSWAPERTGQDPLDRVTLKQWGGGREAYMSPEDVDEPLSEMPSWNPLLFAAGRSGVDVCLGTFGGNRVAVNVARGDSSKGGAEIGVEVAALRRIGGHPNILSLFASGLSPAGEPYMAMETYEAVGCLLNQFANQYSWSGSSLPSAVATQLFRGIIDAVAHMHAFGVVHRGLRAEGVVVTLDHQAKLADLGCVAKVGTKERVKGDHVAPEVSRGSAQGPAVDCWGLGAILHEVYQGRSDLMDCRFEPPRPRPSTPSRLWDMELFIQEAMLGLLELSPLRRWTVAALNMSNWLTRIPASSAGSVVETTEYEERQYLRRYLGRAPPFTACAATVAASDKGLVGRTLGRLCFEDTGAVVLLVVRSGGVPHKPVPSLQVEAGDLILFGLPPREDIDAVIRKLGRKFMHLAESEPPVTGFQRVWTNMRAQVANPLGQPDQHPVDLKDSVSSPLQIFSPELDCFCFPNFSSRVSKLDVGTIHDLGILVVGLVQPGQSTPEWFPAAGAQIAPGAIGLVLRTPRKDGSSAPTITDSDVETIVVENVLLARLSVRQGLEEAEHLAV
uniref:Protein kinase domain-containing protein n=2 Tax=Alexandrium monilatum TaxID=311494 RepID=A0A7S4WCS3_9DINO